MSHEHMMIIMLAEDLLEALERDGRKRDAATVRRIISYARTASDHFDDAISELDLITRQYSQYLAPSPDDNAD